MTRWAGPLRGVAAGAPAEVSAKEKALLRKAHQTLRRVTLDFDQRWHFNTSIAALMELVNEIQAAEPFDRDVTPGGQKEILTILVQMLGPFAPHLAEELWQALGYGTSLVRQPWPQVRADLAQEEQFEVVIQVNGKLRGRLVVDDGLSEEELLNRALGDARVAAHLSGKRVVKKIVVPNKLVNIVVA